MDALGAVQRIGRGTLIEQINTALLLVAEEVIATGRPGAVSIVLKVSQPTKGEPQVIVEEQVTRKMPATDPLGAHFYAVDGEFHRHDPRQPELELRAVESSADVRSPADPGKTVRGA